MMMMMIMIKIMIINDDTFVAASGHMNIRYSAAQSTLKRIWYPLTYMLFIAISSSNLSLLLSLLLALVVVVVVVYVIVVTR